MTISAKQCGLLRVAVSQLGIDDAGYRALLGRAAGVDSSRDLDNHTFDLVMAELERLGFKPSTRHVRLGVRAGMASPGQVTLLRHLWQEYTDRKGTDRSLGKFLEKFGASDIRFLATERARDVIGALRSMVARKAQHAAGPDRAA